MHLRTLFKTLFCLLIDSLFQLLSALNRNEISGEKWKYGGQIPSDGHFFVVGFDISPEKLAVRFCLGHILSREVTWIIQKPGFYGFYAFQ